MEASLCTDDGASCRAFRASFAGRATGRRGRTVLGADAETRAPGPAPAAPDLVGAMARARATGRPLLVDVGAIWCPPCMQFLNEILEDPSEQELVGRFEVLRVDADRVESWDLKARYRVGGYPTLLVLTGSGDEIARMVGYPGEGPMRAWLRAAAEGASLDTRLARLQAGTLSPSEASILALDLVQAERADDARKALDHAADDVAAHRARMALTGAVEDARWLVDHAMDSWDTWAWDLPDEAMPTLYPLMQGPLYAQMAADPLPRAASAMEFLAYHAGELAVGAEPLHAVAAALLNATLTGDPRVDAPTWSSLVHHLQAAGALDEAEGVLTRAIAAFPDDFTWHSALAQHHLDAGDPAAALAPALRALETAYGDQRLRAAVTLARVQVRLDRREEAVATLDRIAAEMPRPSDDQAVRTRRYLQAIEDAKAKIARGEDF